jgi:hypothetical protein
VTKPIKKIVDSSNDKAHIDLDAQPEIQFLHSSKDHQFMVDKILKQDQGITFGALFSGDEPEEAEAPVEEEELAEGEERPPKPIVEKLPKFKLVSEVVRDPKIHYYMVPRLGSYLAVRLEYESCLFEEAFDAAVVDF